MEDLKILNDNVNAKYQAYIDALNIYDEVKNKCLPIKTTYLDKYVYWINKNIYMHIKSVTITNDNKVYICGQSCYMGEDSIGYEESCESMILDLSSFDVNTGLCESELEIISKDVYKVAFEQLSEYFLDIKEAES